MQLDEDWFTEVCKESGSAFSLRIKDKLHDEKTPYQHIEIYDTAQFGRLMVIDGFTMLSERDNFIYHEMLSHPVLFTHPDPTQVVIIGGGDCGTLRQVLKHKNIQHVWQIDIDERVTRLAETFFPDLCTSNDDARAQLLFEDGIKWVARSEDQSQDIIIIDSTDPIGPAEGLFTEKFYRDCHRVLRPNGLLIQQSESPLLHLSILKSMYRSMAQAGYRDIQTLYFPVMIYPGGWWSATMAYKDQVFGDFRQQAVETNAFPTRYYNAAVHRGALAVPEYLKGQLSATRLPHTIC